MATDREGQASIPEPGQESPLAFAMAERERSTLSMVQRALRRRDVLLAYQPIVQGRSTTKVAFWEGLIRILDESGRIIPARDFIPTVETTETGRIIDCLALELGLRTLAEEPDLRLSINMSARSIAYPRWMETLERGLEHEPTIAERLILEITESSAMVVPDMVSYSMRGLQRRGISFALDDFGAGFTSFRYLREFYFDAIKIDGQFIRGIGASADNQCLFRALKSIADHFDMFTVAEGVEAAEEAAFLGEIGVDCMQGYYFGAPTTVPPWTSRHERRAG